jgi:hypothetical protein
MARALPAMGQQDEVWQGGTNRRRATARTLLEKPVKLAVLPPTEAPARPAQDWLEAAPRGLVRARPLAGGAGSFFFFCS